MIPRILVLMRRLGRRRGVMPPRPLPPGYHSAVPPVPPAPGRRGMVPPPPAQENGGKTPPYPILGRGCYIMPPPEQEDDDLDDDEDIEEEV